MPKICYRAKKFSEDRINLRINCMPKESQQPVCALIGPIIKLPALLAAVAWRAEWLHIILRIGASKSDRFNVVNGHWNSAADKANTPVHCDHFSPLSVSQPMPLNFGLTQALIGPSKYWICQTVRSRSSLLFGRIFQVMRSAKLLSAPWMLCLPFTQVSSHSGAVGLLVLTRLMASANLALRVITATASLPVKVTIRPQTLALLARLHQNNAAFTH